MWDVDHGRYPEYTAQRATLTIKAPTIQIRRLFIRTLALFAKLRFVASRGLVKRTRFRGPHLRSERKQWSGSICPHRPTTAIGETEFGVNR